MEATVGAIEDEDGESIQGAVGLYLILCFTAMLPIWWVEYFFATDVPAHLHSAHLFSGLLSGGDGNAIFVLNNAIVPNSLGHWLMSALLVFLSPSAVSKVTASLTWAGFAGSIAWSRYCLRRAKGLKMAVLTGAVLASNFLWLLGLYNFILAVAVCLVAIGFLYKWDGKLTSRRSAILAVMAVAVFFGHLVAFGVLVMAAGVHIVFGWEKYERRGILLTGAAFIPGALLLSVYELLKFSDASLAPRWILAESRFSIYGVASYIKHSDPLTMIGDYNLAPFVNGEAALYILASPTLWFAVAMVILAVATLKRRRSLFAERRAPLLLMLLVFVLAAATPEEFGPAQGSILRPRLVLILAALFVPLIAAKMDRGIRSACYLLLAVAFGLQTAALWEYSLKHDREARAFLSVTERVQAGDRIASVMVLHDEPKFHESAIKRLSSIVGVARGSVVWDNYETGYYFFPVVAATEADRQFIRDLSSVNTFRTKLPGEAISAEQLGMFKLIMDSGGDRIDTLIVWGQDEQVDALLARRFGPTPYFENGMVRLYRRTR